MTMERKLAAVVQQTEGGTQLLPPRDGQQQHPIEVGIRGRCNNAPIFSFYDTFLAFFFYRFVCVFLFLIYSRTPLIRPPSESHCCGRIRGMVAREGFVYEQKPLSVTRNVVV